MQTLKNTTKKAKNYINSYYNAINNGIQDLYQCYTTYSNDKVKAMQYCKKLQSDLNGQNGYIVTYNIYQFTYAFIYYDKDNKKHLVYITKCNNFDIIL